VKILVLGECPHVARHGSETPSMGRVTVEDAEVHAHEGGGGG
jgi:hypothetical protein